VLAKAATATPDKHNKKVKEYFYYALPSNYFVVTVKVNKIRTFEGPLSDYAGQLTGLSSVVKENAVHYEITDITLHLEACPDEKQVYYVEVPTNDVSIRKLYQSLLFPACNATRKENDIPKAFAPADDKLYTQNRFSMYTADAMMEKYDTTYTIQIIDTVEVQVPKITKQLVAKPTKQQAQETIDAIQKIRDAYWWLISGDYDNDFSNLSLMLNELKQKENEYLALFAGITETEELTCTFVITPSTQEDNTRIPLFYFSDRQGMVSKDENISKTTYTLSLKLSAMQHAVDAADEQFMSSTTEKEQGGSVAKNTGLFYRQPQYYSVSIYDGEHLVKNFGVYPVAQLGERRMLPENIHSFEIDPLTGALLYMETAR
jgi:hypothetical protein